MDRRNGFPQTWQEARRKRAFELEPHGWKQWEIAEALGVSPAAVSQGLAKVRAHGVEAWRAKPRSTGPIKLTGDHWGLILELLSYGAEAYGCRGECWTCARVATVIGAEFGPWYHKAHVEGRTIVFVDESGFYLLPGPVRTYAPCGQTPILRWPYTRDHLSVMSGITMDGRLYTMVRDEALDRLESVVFLKHVLPHVSDSLLVIWDGSPIHKGKVRAS